MRQGTGPHQKEYRNSMVVYDHLGNRYESRREMLAHYGITPTDFHRGMTKKLSLEAILSGKATRKQHVTDHKGVLYPNETEMLKKYGISRYLYHKKLAEGCTQQEALETQPTPKPKPPQKEPITDHLGNTFPSHSKLCEYWGISLHSYFNRKALGWPIKRIIEEPVKAISPSHHGRYAGCTDHEGNSYSSQREMCRHWNVSEDLFIHRTKRGWTVEQALTHKKGEGRRPAVDHLGNTYPTVTEMCKHWDISTGVYEYRRIMGYSIEEALTLPPNTRKTTKFECKDHLGNSYPTIGKMCIHYGIGRDVYRARLRNGHTLQYALTEPVKPSPRKPSTDHLGNTYDTQKAMCDHYGLSVTVFTSRLTKYKGDLKKALTEPLDPLKKTCTDHTGRKFNSIKEMCNYWNIPYKVYNSRRRLGWTLKDILEKPMRLR